MDMMHLALQAYLNEVNKKAVPGWNVLWEKARARRGDPFPCPECYANGRVTPLFILPPEDGKGMASCKVCGKTFVWPKE